MSGYELRIQRRRFRSSGHRQSPCAAGLDDPERVQNFNQTIDLLGRPRDLEDNCFRPHIHNPGTKNLRDLKDLLAYLAIGGNLDQSQFSLDS